MPSLKRKSDLEEKEEAKEEVNSEADNVNHVEPRLKKRKHVKVHDLEETNGDSDELPKSQNADFDVPDEAEAGVVERISVSNFMCHKRLEVSLCANVNFIIGRNGSGKSAILTGLIVGLGGKANATSRGNSLKGFIKLGCSAATILVTLRNRGCDAYKPEEYGDKITVERRLTIDGSGGYKIKSADNRVISTKKDELIEMLDQFNIQIDNPVSILTQDTARSFLNTSNEKDKYAFFLKATQLEQMSSDYQLTIEEKERTRDMLRKKREVIPDLLEQVKIHQEKYKDMQQLQVMESTIQELKKDLAWALVGEKKLEVHKAKEVEDQCAAKIPSYEKHVNDALVREEEIQESYINKGEELKSFSDEVQVLVNEKTDLHISYKNMRKTAMHAQEQYKRFERDIRLIEKDRTCLLSKIEEIKCSVQRDRELLREEREKQLAEKTLLHQQYKNQLATSNHHLGQVDMSIKRNQEQKYRMQNKMRDMQRQIESIRKRIASLQASEKDRLSQYGHYTDAILKAIELADRQKKFHKKPIGPIGSFIKINDYKWALAVEKCIKGTMRAYACHDNHDMLILKSIFKKYCTGQYPPIIVCSFADELYNTSKLRPTSNVQITVVMDVLTIENHIAANTLVDQCSIDTILLVADPEEAQKLMWNNCPRGAHKAISSEGHEIIGGRSSKFYSNKDRNVRYLQKDVAASIRNAETELLQVQQEQKEEQKRLTSLEGEIRRDRGEYDKTRKKCSHEQDQINNVMMTIKELESVEEEKLPDVDALETEVEECDQRILQLSSDLNDSKYHYSEKMTEYEEIGKRMKECDERCQVAVEKLEALKDESTALENKLVTIKGHKKHYKDKLSELMAIIEKARVHYEEVFKDYENTHSQATKYCEERIPTKSTKSLECEIIKGQKRIAAEESSKGSITEVSEKYHNALHQYDKAKREIDNCIKFRKAIDRAVKRRAKRYADFQKLIVIRAVRFFQMLLSQRGYSGKLKFDHENETLAVQVNVEKSQGTSTKDSKALSGGERSFATICFIMALWEAMEAPFRCLDEFDVFMDMLNRRISMNMLMKIAKEQQTRQFIFLTPQDMSNVQGSSRVRILKLIDPERGQQTIPFQPT